MENPYPELFVLVEDDGDEVTDSEDEVPEGGPAPSRVLQETPGNRRIKEEGAVEGRWNVKCMYSYLVFDKPRNLETRSRNANLSILCITEPRSTPFVACGASEFANILPRNKHTDFAYYYYLRFYHG